MTDTDTVLQIAELVGIFAFAISGAAAAVHKNLDIFGIFVVSVVTAFGGGVIRDLILGFTPPRIFFNYWNILIAAVGGLCVVIFFACVRQEEGKAKNVFAQIVNLMDAIGLAAFTVTGCGYACQSGQEENWVLTIFVGVITGIGGGMLRDTMVQIPMAVLRKHIYALASFSGAVVFLILRDFHVADPIPPLVAMGLTVLIRILATCLKWNLPKVQDFRRLLGKESEEQERRIDKES